MVIQMLVNVAWKKIKGSVMLVTYMNKVERNAT